MPARPFRSFGPFTVPDLFVYALILGLGALPFFLYERAPDFLHEDVGFVDRADALLHGSYPERVEPPGFPSILALVCSTLGCTHNVLIQTMPVFFTWGFLLSYEVIRRQRGRPIAAVICLLLIASPNLFLWVTSWLWPSFPYFFVSMLVLFLVPKLEAAGTGRRRFFAASLLIVLITAAIMIQSAGTALFGGLLGWAVLSFCGDRTVAKQRLKFILPMVLIPLLAEVLWLQQGSNPRDWPLRGRGESYLSQLKLKNGNYPEMGLASPKDVVWRVEKNLKERALFLGDVVIRSWISPSWVSLGVAVPIVLIVMGVWNSLWRSESQLCALYFVGYECIYLLWPWSFEVPRFALPVLPLACLYVAEGVIALKQWYDQYPRRVGLSFLPLSVILAFWGMAQGWRPGAGRGLQDKVSVIFWIMSAIICVRLVWKGPLTFSDRLSWQRSFLRKRYPAGGLSFSPVQLLAALVVTCLVATGVAADISIGRQNLTSGSTKLENLPEFQAARWIQAHTEPNVIIASRNGGLIYHYSRRRVIWFPPITNPKVLMQGIREHHINYVIVINRNFSYYLPQETICFDLLYSAYPEAFRLVEMRGQVRIYEVLQDSGVSAVERAN